jgi:hypothetical protein
MSPRRSPDRARAHRQNRFSAEQSCHHFSRDPFIDMKSSLSYRSRRGQPIIGHSSGLQNPNSTVRPRLIDIALSAMSHPFTDLIASRLQQHRVRRRRAPASTAPDRERAPTESCRHFATGHCATGHSPPDSSPPEKAKGRAELAWTL